MCMVVIASDLYIVDVVQLQPFEPVLLTKKKKSKLDAQTGDYAWHDISKHYPEYPFREKRMSRALESTCIPVLGFVKPLDPLNSFLTHRT